MNVHRNGNDHVHKNAKRKANGRNTQNDCKEEKKQIDLICRPHRRSSSQSSDETREELTVASGLNRLINSSELNDLAIRKKAEIDRLAELERDRLQLL